MLFNGDKLYMFPSETPEQCMGFLFAGGGDVIGIDSCTAGEAESIEKVITELGGRVHCWFLSHAHHDHIEGIVEIMRRGKITIDSVCFLFPSTEYVERVESNACRDIPVMQDFDTLLAKSNIRVIRPCKGEAIRVGHFEILPLSDGNTEADSLNATSIVYRVNTSGKSVLFLGDMDWRAEDSILEEFPEEIKCPVVQMAHHGQDGVTEKFYQAVKPEVALWCTPEWLWSNDIGGGFNTGPFKTVTVRGWMEKLGTVKENYRFGKELIILE